MINNSLIIFCSESWLDGEWGHKWDRGQWRSEVWDDRGDGVLTPTHIWWGEEPQSCCLGSAENRSGGCVSTTHLCTIAYISPWFKGAPLIIHPGPEEESPFQILDILEDAGADISHTVMAHLDRTIYDNDRLLQFAKRGCYLEYDLFGIECSHDQVARNIR